MQTEAMLRSHSNNPIGKRYNDAYALLEKPVPELARMNKTDRNQFIWCWQQREALERWWPTNAQNQRDRWSHPDGSSGVTSMTSARAECRSWCGHPGQCKLKNCLLLPRHFYR